MSAIRVSRSGSLPTRGAARGATSAAVAREWQRFTPAQRLSRFAVYLALVAAVVVSLRHRWR
jgi:hypothetical protein